MKVYLNNQPEIITFYIKYYSIISDNARRFINFLEFIKTLKLMLFYF